MNKLPKVGVGVIIKKEGKVLMGKRKGSNGDGFWGFPGGRLEYHEEFFDCAIREVKEEANILIGNLEICGITNDSIIEDDTHFVSIFVSAQRIGGDLKNVEPHKLECWKRVDPNNLPDKLFLPIKNLLKQGYTL